MNTSIEDPDHEEVSYVVDGRTGEAFSPTEYAQRSADQTAANMSQRFVKGPIPLPWLIGALTQTPSAVKCALALFYQRGLSRSDSFKIEPARFRELGVDDTSRRRGLKELEGIGLIRLRRETSKSPVVCILPYPPRTHHQK